MAEHSSVPTSDVEAMRPIGVRLEEPAFTAGGAPFVDRDELAWLKSAGPLVLICEGELDGATLSAVIGLFATVREDVLAMTDETMTGLPALDQRCIYFSGLPNRSSYQTNYRALRRAVGWLRRKGALLVFPSGERSHWTAANTFSPVIWGTAVVRGIRLTNAAGIPVFAGREEVQGAHRPVVRLGEPVTFQSLSAFRSERHAIAYLRWRTAMLEPRP